ncbi:hypothetical protein ACFL6R_06550 [Gemmatimonadota bacterium]
MKYLIGLLILGMCFPVAACSLDNPSGGEPQLTETGPITFGGPGDDDGVAVVPAGDGGWYVVANTLSFGAGETDIWLVKTDSTFTMEWERTFGTEGDDRAWNAIPDGNGGILIGGFVGGYASETGDIVFIQVDAEGETGWYRTYDLPGRQARGYVQQVGDDGYVLSGWSHAPGELADYLLIRTDATGEMLWHRTFGGDGQNGANSVRVTDDGGFAIFGEGLWSGGDDYEIWQGILVRTDSSGNLLWRREYGLSGAEEAYSLALAHDGGFLAGGFSASDGTRGGYCVKCSPQGTQIWWRRFNIPMVAFQIVPVTGGYLVVGPGGLCKLDEQGDSLWAQRCSEISGINGLAVKPDGSIVIIGVTAGASSDRDVALLLTDDEGNPL